MKITDVTVTMWEWKDIPATRYTKTVTSTKSRSTQMGLLKILTDEGETVFEIGEIIDSQDNRKIEII